MVSESDESDDSIGKGIGGGICFNGPIRPFKPSSLSDSAASASMSLSILSYVGFHVYIKFFTGPDKKTCGLLDLLVDHCLCFEKEYFLDILLHGTLISDSLLNDLVLMRRN